MPATNVRPSSVSEKVGGSIWCLYDGYPRVHSVEWEVIKSEHDKDVDSYYNNDGGNDNSADNSGINIDNNSSSNGDINGGSISSGNSNKSPSFVHDNQTYLMLLESGKVEVRCRVNNTYASIKEAAVAGWRGMIDVEEIG